MTRLRAWLDGVAVIGPGLVNWRATESILAGRLPYASSPTIIPPPSALPAVERRRTGRTVHLALAIGFEAVQSAGLEAATLATVFASSGGDGANCHAICESLAAAERELSPTRFHNSVHNAPSGYWSIATGARAASTALCAFDASFAAGCIEAMTYSVVERTPVLLIAYDDRYPAPLASQRPIPDAFGVGLALAAEPGPRSLARLDVHTDVGSADRLEDAPLERLRGSIPAARSLPLLRAIALQAPRSIRVEYLGATSLCIELTPC
jgi:hypothetical protein